MKMIADYWEYADFNDGVHYLSFRLEIPFLGIFVLENETCQFKLKFGI